MKKSMCGLALAAVLTACGGTEDTGPSLVTDEEGRSVLIMEGEGDAQEPLASFSESNPNAISTGAGCWVVLDWCKSPSTGTAVCHQNGQCSQKQFVEACFKLYKKYC
ncbi:MAG: hypothetical protein ABW123_05025 [Cystobacter sp.]